MKEGCVCVFMWFPFCMYIIMSDENLKETTSHKWGKGLIICSLVNVHKVIRSPSCDLTWGLSVASSPGHSQILSRNCGEKSQR